MRPLTMPLSGNETGGMFSMSSVVPTEDTMNNLIFVDCEATGPCPGIGQLTEFGAVHYVSRATFHGVLFERRPRPDNPDPLERTGRAFDPIAVFTAFETWLTTVTSGRCVFVSDNP